MADVSASTSTTSSISIGGIVNGQLDPAAVPDHDWYRISLTAGQSITISFSGTGVDPVEDTYLALRDSSGNVIKWNDDSGGQIDLSKIVFTATTSGTYYIDVGSFDSTSADWNPDYAPSKYTGTYTLSVQPYVAPPTASYDTIANELINGWWNSQGLTAHHFNVSQGGTITVDYSQLTPAERTLAIAALNEWHDIIGVNFTAVTNGTAQITFVDSDTGSQAYTEDYTDASGAYTTSATVHISSGWVSDYGTTLDSYTFQTYVHEIGHALGLGHAGNYNGDADYAADALFANDAWSTSIMSYFSQEDNTYFQNQGFTFDLAGTPMIADIIAMQQMYGLSTTTRAGDTTYGFNSNADRDIFKANLYSDVAYTIFDSGGVDTLDYSGYGQNQRIDLNPEAFSNVGTGIGNVVIARGVIIENAIGGSGSDSIFGNSVANSLKGNGGNDSLYGYDGNDNLNGGAGADTLQGGNGDDFLDGGAGADFLDGGAGNDRIVYDSTDNAVQVNGGAGSDVLIVNNRAAPTSFGLGAHGFESAEVNQTDTGGNSWSTKLSTYNANWQMVSQDTHYDDGTRTWTSFDATNAQTWSQVWFKYDTQGREISETYYYDDGKRSWVALDANNSQTWNQAWFAYDAQGRQTSETYYYDDGKRSWVTFDADNSQTWSKVWFAYDAQGHKLSETYYYDDGTRSWVGFDANNTQAWNDVWYSYDKLGRETSEDRHNDDGTRVWTAFDADSSQTWSNTQYFYDTQGHLYQQFITWDDGHTSLTHF